MAMAKLRVLSDDEKDGVGANAPVSVNRIRHVREQQGVSLRTAARRMNKDIRSIRSEEDEDSDLRISQLKRWQEVLDVPMIDLLQEPGGPLSRPVLERAKLLRIMKTAVSIAENATEEPIQRFAQMLREQLIDLNAGIGRSARLALNRSKTRFRRNGKNCGASSNGLAPRFW